MSSRGKLALPLSALLTLILGTLLAASSFAGPADDLLQLQQMRLAAQKSLSDFYMYNAMEGDQRYARMIKDAAQRAQTRFEGMAAQPGEAAMALQGKLQQQWQDYHDRLQQLMATMQKQGFTDLQPIAALAKSNEHLMELSQELYQTIQQESGQSVPALTQRSREQSLLMQNIALDYASRSASIGGSFFGGGEERAIDEQVREFASGLDALAQAPQNTPEITTAIGNIVTKFRYIEKSLLNYNQNTVPFLVNKYSDSIIEGLEEVAALYAVHQL